MTSAEGQHLREGYLRAPLFVRLMHQGVVNLSVNMFDAAEVSRAELGGDGGGNGADLTVHTKLCWELMTLLGVSPLRAARILAGPM